MAPRIYLRFSLALFMACTVFSVTTTNADQDKKNVEKLQVKRILDRTSAIPGMVSRGQLKIDQIPDPHWQQDRCQACHKKRPDKSGLHLRQSDTNRLCNTCHDLVWPHSYIHPVGMRPDKAMRKRMPREFLNTLKKSKGKINCATCHDIPMTCVASRARERHTNPRFFRGGPYRERTDLCYLCHDAKQYQRINPHDQITAKGKVKKQTCLVCHADGEKLAGAKNIGDVDFNIKTDLSKMCSGCHPWVPHPGGSFSFTGKGKPNHLVTPMLSMQRRMKTMSKKNGIVLPLSPDTNRVFCGTCHNSHEKGIIKRHAAARGADSKNRLRMQKMCTNCHDK